MVSLSVALPKIFSFKNFSLPLFTKCHSTGSTKARRYPLSYILPGYYYWRGGNLYGQGTDGNWWPTSAYSSTNAYHLAMHSSALNPQYNLNKAYGFPLRCAVQNSFQKS
ncbi:hypothetical protein IJG78_01320 [Candidatus Saccharibacteria bacterium]|nr:hypothetical protein [Candidatus Saccharibacteria bacterium]